MSLGCERMSGVNWQLVTGGGGGRGFARGGGGGERRVGVRTHSFLVLVLFVCDKVLQ